MKKIIAATLMVALAAVVSGCGGDENARLVEMAERHTERIARQNEQMAELSHEVAEGSRQLVAADAEARRELVALQRDIQTERAEVGQQRDGLEAERRAIASQRHRDPLIAAALTNLGLVLACVLPLAVCLLLLWRSTETAADSEVSELLISDLAAERPILLPPPGTTRPSLNDGRLREGPDDRRNDA